MVTTLMSLPLNLLIMNSIPQETVNKMVEVIKTISEQSKDNPQIVESIFGFAIVKACDEVQAELELKN